MPSLRTLPYISLFTVLVGLTACIHQKTKDHGIIIDSKGVNMAAYQQDLNECVTYAEDVNVGEKTAAQAAGGAVIGGAVGAIWGDSSSAARGAGSGGLLGGVKGYSQAAREKQQVTKRCLRGRGYKVLN